MPGKLWLIPAALSEHNPKSQLPESSLTAIYNLRYFIAERAKTARRYLKSIDIPVPISELQITELNKHGADDLKALLRPCTEGMDMALISEAGVPGVADPGEHIIREAHRIGIEVMPLVGPSSLLLALMACGMNGQRFCFHSYLPRDQSELQKALNRLETESRQRDQTQMFIETPYRNERIWTAMMKYLGSNTEVGIAQNVLAPDQVIKTQSVSAWKKQGFVPNRNPAVFTIYSVS